MDARATETFANVNPNGGASWMSGFTYLDVRPWSSFVPADDPTVPVSATDRSIVGQADGLAASVLSGDNLSAWAQMQSYFSQMLADSIQSLPADQLPSETAGFAAVPWQLTGVQTFLASAVMCSAGGATPDTTQGQVLDQQFREFLEQRGQKSQQGLDRKFPGKPDQPGRVDGAPGDGANKLNRFTEVGPASPTGVAKKLEELNSIPATDGASKTAILYEKLGKIPNAGDVYQHLELSHTQLQQLADQIKTNKLTTDAQVWEAAKKLAGKVDSIKITEKAAKAGTTVAAKIAERETAKNAAKALGDVVDDTVEAAAEKALKQGVEAGAKGGAEAAAKTGTRLGKFAKKAAPLVIGVIIDGIFFPGTAEAKGTDRAVADMVVGNIPIVEWGVAGVELITGKDVVPDKGRPWYGGLRDNWNWLWGY